MSGHMRWGWMAGASFVVALAISSCARKPAPDVDAPQAVGAWRIGARSTPDPPP